MSPQLRVTTPMSSTILKKPKRQGRSHVCRLKARRWKISAAGLEQCVRYFRNFSAMANIDACVVTDLMSSGRSGTIPAVRTTRYWLLSVAVSCFGDEDCEYTPLPFAVPYARELASKAAGFGYTKVKMLADLPFNELGSEVERFLDSRTADDIVIVHIISHGVIHERTGKLHVVGADGRYGPRTDVERWLTTVEGASAGSLGPRVLFLVDLCYSGTVARLDWLGNVPDEQRRAWVIAAAGTRAPAYSGCFTKAVIQTLCRYIDGAGDISPDYENIPVTVVAREIRRQIEELSNGQFDQRPISTPADPTSVPDFPFFPNPTHKTGPAQIARSRLDEVARPFLDGVDELVDWRHFVSRATGDTPAVDSATIAPGMFRGRSRELRRIAGVLDSPSARPCIVLVTGSPGAGKSALLGLTICAAYPDLSDATFPLWREHRDSLPAVHAALAAVHCRQRYLSEIAASICRQLRLPETSLLEVLENMLADDRRNPAILLDALDEANDSAAAVATFVHRLASLARVVAGTRPRAEFSVLRRMAAQNDMLVDLDAAPVSELRHDLATYVEDLLRPAYRTTELRASRKIIAKTVARELTRDGEREPTDPEDRWGGFLVARLFAHQLRDRPTIPEPAEAARVARTVPRSLPEVFELDLRSSQDRWQRPVLTALAHNAGMGMPRSIIRAVSGGFSDAEPTDSEVVDALAAASFYLRQDTDRDGTKLYRLFHQGLVDHFRSVAVTDHTLLTTLFSRMIATLGGPTRWGTAEPYLLQHAAAHAEAAGEFTRLLRHPGFLVFGDPGSIHARIVVMPEGDRPSRDEFSYAFSYEQHRHRSPRHRRSILLLDAFRLGYPDLAQELASVADLPPLTWRMHWATVNESEFVQLGQQVAYARRPAVIGGSPDAPTIAIGARERLEIVDVLSREVRYTIPRGNGPNIRCLAIGRVAGQTLSCISVEGWQIEISVYADGQELVAFPLNSQVARATFQAVDGQAVLILVTVDNEISGWRLPDGAKLFNFEHDQPIGASTFGVVEGRAIAVLELGGRLQVRELSDCSAVRRITGTTSSIADVCLGRVGDRPVIAAISRYGVVDVWDAETLRFVRVLLVGSADGRVGSMHPHHHALSIGQVDGAPIIFVANESGTVSGWNLSTGAQTFRRTTPYGRIQAMTFARVPEPVLLIAHGYSITVLDARAGAERMRFTSALPDALHRSEDTVVRQVHDAAVTSIAIMDTTMITAGADGTTRLWNLASRTKEPLNYRDRGSAVALSTFGGQRVALSVGRDAVVRLWNIETGGTFRQFKQYYWCPQARLVSVGGNATHILTALGSSVEIWNVATGKRDHAFAAPDLVTTSCMATGDPDSPHLVVAVGHRSGDVSIWRPGLDKNQIMLDSPFDGEIQSVSVCRSDVGETVVASSPDSSVRVWDASTGQLLHIFGPPRSALRCLATAWWSGRAVLLLGHSDGVLLAYDLATADLLTEAVFPEPVNALDMDETGNIAVGFGRDVAVISIGRSAAETRHQGPSGTRHG